MHFSIALLLTFIVSVFALPPVQKPVVVQYPEDTPSSIIDKAMEEITKDGGIITHEYCRTLQPLTLCITDRSLALIKGFAAQVSEVTLEKISVMAEAFAPYIEEDYVVRVDGSTSSDAL